MTTFHIQANEKGSRFIDVSEEQMGTIKKYNLFDGLIVSSGICRLYTSDAADE